MFRHGYICVGYSGMTYIAETLPRTSRPQNKLKSFCTDSIILIVCYLGKAQSKTMAALMASLYLILSRTLLNSPKLQGFVNSTLCPDLFRIEVSDCGNWLCKYGLIPKKRVPIYVRIKLPGAGLAQCVKKVAVFTSLTSEATRARQPTLHRLRQICNSNC